VTESQSLSVQRYNVAADDGRGLVHLDGCVALNGCSTPPTINVFTDSARYEMALLHFACVVDDAKCIAVTRVCVSVSDAQDDFEFAVAFLSRVDVHDVDLRRDAVCLSVCRMPTLSQGPGCNLGEW